MTSEEGLYERTARVLGEGVRTDGLWKTAKSWATGVALGLITMFTLVIPTALVVGVGLVVACSPITLLLWFLGL